MTIYAKLGTGPGGYYTVKNKRNAPTKGAILLIRPFTAGTYTKWDQVLVSEIREVGGQPFYILERW